jgi:uncharacterized protein YbaR (Trm112 family)
MGDFLRLDEDTLQMLRCPACKSRLSLADNKFMQCLDRACHQAFPIIDGIPILINESASVFSIQDLVKLKHPPQLNGRLKRTGKILIPSITRNIKAKKNYLKFADLLTEKNPAPRILVVGGGIIGNGLDTILCDTPLQFIETDVSLGPRTSLVCDAHDIPFHDETFDGVIAQAVLEHVVDPYRCVDEIHRVLKSGGIIYAETPFMQQVHAGRYDFTRFTHLGHRRLFRKFEEIEGGATCGPGMALAWSYKNFLLSFLSPRTSKLFRLFTNAFAHLTSFWLKYFDSYLIDRAATLDSASVFYFLGSKSNQTLMDKELIRLYKGCNHHGSA